MLILNCNNSISSCCSDFGLARVLSTINAIIQIIHIIVPIILIIMVAIKLTQLVINPDEKKSKKSLFNMTIAAVVIFFIPTIINVFINMLPNSYEISGCMKAAGQINNIAKNNKVIYKTINKEKKKSVITDPSAYEKGDPKKEDEENQNTDVNVNVSSDGSILLIAGHSYPPYCSTGGLSDCRGKASSGYAEEDETRKLVKLIKSNLDSLGVKSDIANAMLSGDTNKMNKSFYLESRRNTNLFNKFNWSKYKYVLEVHFNSSNGSAAGTLLCKKSSSYKTKADSDIVNAVTRHTGKSRLGDSIQSLNNVSYFTKRNIPITYLETEFYDNANAMKVYNSHINEIAHDIAVAIQKHYG